MFGLSSTPQKASSGWRQHNTALRPAQVEAHRLYESLGYRRVPQRDSVDDAGGEKMVFRFALDPSSNASG